MWIPSMASPSLAIEIVPPECLDLPLIICKVLYVVTSENNEKDVVESGRNLSNKKRQQGK